MYICFLLYADYDAYPIIDEDNGENGSLPEPETDSPVDKRGKVDKTNVVLNVADSGLFTVLGHGNVVNVISLESGIG